MTVNPMQRKANNSFLLGMLITLLITGLIIAFLIFQISNLNKEIEAKKANTKYVYMVTGEVKSGTEILASQVRGIEIQSSINSDVAYSAEIKDKEGNPSPDVNGTHFPGGYKAKVDLHPGTIVTSDITYEDEMLGADVRTQEYNIITKLSQIQTGDYIDVRLRLPTGQDYIVVTHKQVTIPEINGVSSTDCMWLDLREDEILTMSSAIIESYMAEGSMLYATKYVEPGIQGSATLTYIPSDGVLQLMSKDTNILDTARSEIFARNNDQGNRTIIRTPIKNAVENDDAEDNIIDKTKEEIQKLQEEREAYIDSLGG